MIRIKLTHIGTIDGEIHPNIDIFPGYEKTGLIHHEPAVGESLLLLGDAGDYLKTSKIKKIVSPISFSTQHSVYTWEIINKSPCAMKGCNHESGLFSKYCQSCYDEHYPELQSGSIV